MKNIKSVSANDDKTSFGDILKGINNPRRDALTKKKTQLETALDNYQSAIARGTATPLKNTTLIKGYLRALYDSKAVVVENMKDALDIAFKEHLCPYCQQDVVSHIDHFLPRSHFPEFSVSRQNLVMSCDRCNSIFKRDYWGNGVRQNFFHPQYNDLLKDEYLEASADYKNQTVVAKFKIRSGLRWSGLMKRHFKHMDLQARYMASSTLTEVPRMQLALAIGNTPAQKLKHLREFVRYEGATTAINTWEHAFYVAVAPLVPTIAAGGLV